MGTVNRYLQRAAHRGFGWPLPADLDDAALEARLFPRAAPVHDRIRPDCAYIHRELKPDRVTLQLRWEEYARSIRTATAVPQFCEIYRQWTRRLRPAMRQVHRAGEKTFIDFSGKRPTLVDRRTGEPRPVELSSPRSAPAASPASRRTRPSSCQRLGVHRGRASVQNNWWQAPPVAHPNVMMCRSNSAQTRFGVRESRHPAQRVRLAIGAASRSLALDSTVPASPPAR